MWDWGISCKKRSLILALRRLSGFCDFPEKVGRCLLDFQFFCDSVSRDTTGILGVSDVRELEDIDSVDSGW
jgi:hypothetical protein